MNIEFLKGLGLDDETASKILDKFETAQIAEYERGLSDGSAQLDELKLSQLIDLELGKFNAKNPDILKKLIDISLITLEEGQLVGLSEQIEAIKQENPFLFEDDAPAPRFTVRPKASDTVSKASFDKMSYMDRVKLYSKNPALYKKLKG